ncbi:MAG: hypothetical protein AB2A00_35285, partial [Myxococcota bacterium]
PPPPPTTPQPTTTTTPPPPAAPTACVTRTGNDWMLQPCVLQGPTGQVSIGGGPAVIHIWLQACGDCMPQFNAMKSLRESGRARWSASQYNVAYGRADPSWAASYGVDENLAFDPRDNFIGPLGIGTFTTLVFNSTGRLVGRYYPTSSDYAAQVASALATM